MFCPNTSSLDFWQDKGIPTCLFNVVSSSVSFGFIFLFGSVQVWFYGKYSHNIDNEYIHRSYLFMMQLFLHFALMMESLVRFAIETTLINKNQFYSDLIINSSFTFVMWIMAILLLNIERRKALPSVPSRGHGLILLMFWSLVLIIENLTFISWQSPEWFWKLKTFTQQTRFSLWLFRYVCTFLVFVIGLGAPGVPKRRYGLLINDANATTPTLQPSTWKGLFKKMRTIAGFLWPRNNLLLQLNAIFCVILIVIMRLTGLLVPVYTSKIINQLSAIPNAHNYTMQHFVTTVQNPELWPWGSILILTSLRFLQGSGIGASGFITNLRQTLWVKVEQYTALNIATKLFGHLHSLSLKWHLSRKTGEVLRVISRGTDSVNNLTEYLLFNIIPTFVDIIIAIVYFVLYFNMWFGIIVFSSVALYLCKKSGKIYFYCLQTCLNNIFLPLNKKVFTIVITEWRSKFRRELIELDNKVSAKAVDSLLNFETVKYFGAEKYEVENYKDAFLKYQRVEWISTWSMWLLNFAQSVIISFGLLVGTLYAAWLVAAHEGLTVGDYVLFTTYVVQLYAPLNFLGSYYRMIQQSFIDMENMFSMLDEEQDIKDLPNALPLRLAHGAVEFDNVVFNYSNERKCLKGISFKVPAGETLAIVGPSGAGKSTIVRLLFRFYDVNSGSIKIDGQDIRLVTQESLRSALGVVPQDTVLFNNDIKYNIRYGRVSATDDEVQNAAAASDLHQAILTFEKGYETLVGERGLKLSGGEKQRVAIARTLLKAPQIVLLDEATSALDTKTERNIQNSLKKISENRTTIIIAHRLSTIINANKIIVLKDGEIAESGTHADLLNIDDGIYASMWNQQLQSFDEGGAATNKPDENEKS